MELIEQARLGVLAILAALLLIVISMLMLVDAIVMRVVRAAGLKPAVSPFELCFVKRQYWGSEA